MATDMELTILPLGGAGVDAHALDLHRGGAGVEVLVLQLSQGAAVYGVGEVAAKALHVKVLDAGTDLLVGGKGDLDGAVGRLFLQDLPGGAEDLRHPGLVVAPQQGGAVGGDQGLALVLQQGGEVLGRQGEAAFSQGDGAAVVMFDHLGLDVLAGHAAVGVHVGDKAQGGLPLGGGGNGPVDEALLVHVGVLDAHLFHQVHDVGPQDFLPRGAGKGAGGLVRASVIGDQV